MRFPKITNSFLSHLLFNLTLGFLFNYSLGLFQSLTTPLFVMTSLTGLVFLLKLSTPGSLDPVAEQPGGESECPKYTLVVKFLLLGCTMWLAEIVVGVIPIILDAGLVLASMLMLSIGLMGLVILPLGLLEIFGIEL